MAITPAQKTAILDRTRANVAELNRIINELKYDRTRFSGLGLSIGTPVTGLTDADLTGELQGLTAAETGDAQASIQAVIDLWETHKTNLLKFSK